MPRSLKQNPLRNETEIIERIWRALPTKAGKKSGDWLRLGVGDDAAVISAAAGRGGAAVDWVLSTDAFLEGVHFLPGVHSPIDIGYKALARATSDLAAMGAAPRFFLLSIGLPTNRTGAWLDGFLKGMAQAAREFGMVLIGGDTSRFASTVISVTVGGQAVRSKTGGGQILTRSGARPGDFIYVSGTLGAAQLGLEVILHGLDGNARKPRIPHGKQWKRLLHPHLRPKIHLALGQWLAGENPSGRPIASAAIDTSDGLSTDLNHLCVESGVGARIWATAIPSVRVPEGLRCRGFTTDPLKLALHGGEDYQLLFTVSPAAARRLPKQFRGVLLTQIGEIVRHRGIRLCEKASSGIPLQRRGWDSFQQKTNHSRT
jgi:thiamine-monophosphate kinase